MLDIMHMSKRVALQGLPHDLLLEALGFVARDKDWLQRAGVGGAGLVGGVEGASRRELWGMLELFLRRSGVQCGS